MNKIEKVKEKVLEELKENYDSSIYEPILFFEGGDIAIELAIKLTAKEIFDEIENVKHFCRTIRNEEWINVGVFENHLKEVKKSFGVEK